MVTPLELDKVVNLDCDNMFTTGKETAQKQSKPSFHNVCIHNCENHPQPCFCGMAPCGSSILIYSLVLNKHNKDEEAGNNSTIPSNNHN